MAINHTTIVRRLALAGILIAFAGCAGTSPIAPADPAATTDEIPAPPAEEAVYAPSAPTIVPPATNEIVGWRAADLRRHLGRASLVRRDLNSEIWQYKTEACVLFFFLYPDADGPRVTHMDMRGPEGMEKCLVSVMRANGRAGQG